MSQARDAKHLTAKQREHLRELFDAADTRELLLAVAGIVRHDVADYKAALRAGELINKAANTICK